MPDRLQEVLRMAERVRRDGQAFGHARADVREEAGDRRAAVTAILDPDGRRAQADLRAVLSDPVGAFNRYTRSTLGNEGNQAASS